MSDPRTRRERARDRKGGCTSGKVRYRDNESHGYARVGRRARSRPSSFCATPASARVASWFCKGWHLSSHQG